MINERHIAHHMELPPSEELVMVMKIKEFSKLDITKAKPETLLPKVKEIIDFLDPKLRVSGQDYETGKFDDLCIGEYVVRKTKVGNNYNLLLTNFLEYNFSDGDNPYLNIPSIRFIYDIDTKQIEHIDKMVVDKKGRHYTVFPPVNNRHPHGN